MIKKKLIYLWPPGVVKMWCSSEVPTMSLWADPDGLTGPEEEPRLPAPGWPARGTLRVNCVADVDDWSSTGTTGPRCSWILLGGTTFILCYVVKNTHSLAISLRSSWLRTKLFNHVNFVTRSVHNCDRGWQISLHAWVYAETCNATMERQFNFLAN